MLTLVALGLCLLYASWTNGAYGQQEWLHCLLFLCVLATTVFLRGGRSERARTWGSAATFALTALLPLYVLLQAMPLPGGVVGALSPARGALAAMLSDFGLEPNFYPISVHAAKTLEYGLRFIGYALVVLVVREIALRRPARSWSLAAPLVAVAGLQALAGMLQVQYGEPMAHGSYPNRNHYSGLLEMALPFAPAFSFAALHKNTGRYSSTLGPAIVVAIGWIVAVLLLAGVLLSLSRAGFLIALLGCAQVFLFRFLPSWGPGAIRGRNVLIVAALAVAVAVAFVFLPSDALIHRFADLAATDEVTADGRAGMWSETLDMIQDYWLLGCGAGAFRSAFVAYRLSSPMNQISYAHNDFLQHWAELGLFGFGVALAAIVVLWARTIRRFGMEPDPDKRYLAAACLVSIHSLALHSLVDFNLYIPANAFAFCWILGITAALAQPDPERALPENVTVYQGNFSDSTIRLA